MVLQPVILAHEPSGCVGRDQLPPLLSARTPPWAVEEKSLQRLALISGAGAGAGAGAQERPARGLRDERALPAPGVPGEAAGSGNRRCFGDPAAPAAGAALPDQVNRQTPEGPPPHTLMQLLSLWADGGRKAQLPPE